ncbi:hypothetical protein GCM10008014_08390 [Paenibacillus silvae]|uniref:Phage protein n=1 Tax=Paenibacillus silvae TaxID=1325358 RepID=A0ABQ1Z318_9BACL|nr:hypothetical protein [Paenibacillus silvae]GGH46007.1 hypothetical protein GCM10008014_08390 [Paenibacillus silvae]
MAKFRKKPVEVEARMLVNEREKIAAAIEWVNDIDMSTSAFGRNACIDSAIERGGVEITTLEGTMLARFGDYIIKGVNGEFYSCKPDIFAKTYEPA